MGARPLQRLLIYAVLLSGVALFSLPFLWTLSTALKTPEAVFQFPPQWIPNPAMWENFHRAWTILPFTLFVWNTILITAIATIGSVLSASLVAFGFARFRFRYKNLLFYTMLSTMMLPSQVTMIPVFMIWRDLGAIDTIAPLTIPAFFGGGAFYIFLLRQFYMSIPKELDEAAKIDGAGYLRIWWSVLLPLSKPAVATICVFSLMGHWDDFMGPLIYLNTPEKYTVSIGLRMFQDSQGTQIELLMAAAMIHALPMIVLFFLAQRFFVRGIVTTGLGGR
jgi:ABC-type glycerol-3-phosphate transport system permease component